MSFDELKNHLLLLDLIESGLSNILNFLAYVLIGLSTQCVSAASAGSVSLNDSGFDQLFDGSPNLRLSFLERWSKVIDGQTTLISQT